MIFSTSTKIPSGTLQKHRPSNGQCTAYSTWLYIPAVLVLREAGYLLNDVDELLRICSRKSCHISLEMHFHLQLFFLLSLHHHVQYRNTHYPPFWSCGAQNSGFWLKEDEKVCGAATKQQLIRVEGLLFIIASTITIH